MMNRLTGFFQYEFIVTAAEMSRFLTCNGIPPEGAFPAFIVLTMTFA
jgi:hypothetical protein